MQFRSTALRASVLIGAWTAACSPVLDWREVRPEGAGLVALFPCKPERQTRAVPLAGADVSLQLLACSAAGATWGLGTTDVAEPARVGPALAALRASRLANLDGRELDAQPLRLAGMAPASPAMRLRVAGRRPDGAAITEHALLFARGTRVFHVAVLGGEPSTEALDSFFGGVKLNP